MGIAKDILLVCEDDAHRAFVYQCMKTLGVKNLKWHFCDYTASRVRALHGNRAEVIHRLVNTEYGEWQRRNARYKALLIAIIDADADEIDVARSKLGASKIDGAYKHLFVSLIPKRNIQTWVALAENGTRDIPNESDDYKTSATDSSTKAGVCARKLTRLFIEKIINPDKSIPLEGNSAWRTFFAQMSTFREALKAKSWI